MKMFPLLFAIPLTAVLAASAFSTPRVHHSPKKTASNALAGKLSSKQLASVQSALKSLRKLGAATEVGVSQTDYQSRLIDTKADVNEDLRGIPTTQPIVVHINKCLEAYLDASDAWNDKEDFSIWSTTKDLPLAAPKVVKKYNIVIDYQNPDLQVADRDDLADYFHSVITKGCWKVAHAECDKAEAQLK